MPVAAGGGSACGHHYQMACALGDLLLATRADVGLRGLGGLDATDLHIASRRQLYQFLELVQPVSPVAARIAARRASAAPGHAPKL